MASNSTNLQIVRLHKRPLPQDRRYVDRQYCEFSNPWGLPLIATDGWGDSPHFATRWHYRHRVYPHLDLEHGQDGRYGVEGPIWRAYQSDKRKMGFGEAQKKWGSFIYGRFGDEKYVEHTGGAATNWRKRRGIEIKRA